MDRTIDVPVASYHTGLLELPAIRHALPGARRASRLTVQAVFAHAWHLQTTEGWIVSVTTLPFNGPLGVRLDRSSLHDLGIKPGMHGWLQGSEIVIGHVRVNLDQAVSWDPHPPAPSSMRWGRGDMEGRIVRSGNSFGGQALGGLKAGATFPRFIALLPLAHGWERGPGGEGRIAALRSALLTFDRAAIPGHALSLLGLGPGLTPSGDDVLVGLLAGLFVLGHRVPGSPALSLIPLISETVMEAAPARTTALSRTMLYYAAHGVAVEPLLDVLQALFGRLTADGTVRCLHRLLSIGHSSGRDMLAGAMLALETVERWEDMGAATLDHPA